MNKAIKNEFATFLVNLYFHANKSVRCYMLRVFCNKCQQYSEKQNMTIFLFFLMWKLHISTFYTSCTKKLFYIKVINEVQCLQSHDFFNWLLIPFHWCLFIEIILNDMLIKYVFIEKNSKCKGWVEWDSTNWVWNCPHPKLLSVGRLILAAIKNFAFTGSVLNTKIVLFCFYSH